MNPNEKVILNLQLTAQEVYALRAWLAYSLTSPNKPTPLEDPVSVSPLGDSWQQFQDEHARTASYEVGTMLYRALGESVRAGAAAPGGFLQQRMPWHTDRERVKVFRKWLWGKFGLLDMGRYECVCYRRAKQNERFELSVCALSFMLSEMEACTRFGYPTGIFYQSGWAWNGEKARNALELVEQVTELYRRNQKQIDADEALGFIKPHRLALSRAQLLALLRSPYCVIPESREGEYEDYGGQTLDEMEFLPANKACT